jgi:hypothetical protein
MDLTVQWLVRNIGLEILEGLLLLLEYQMALGPVEIGLQNLFLSLPLLTLRFLLDFFAQIEDIAEIDKCFFGFAQHPIHQSSEIEMLYYMFIRLLYCLFYLGEGLLEIAQDIVDD